MSDNLERLIGNVALGDRKAFSALYDATCTKLFGVALRILNDRASAEDALQETYMKVWRHADRYAANGLSPMTWLITIARNTAIDRLRRVQSAEDVDAMAERLSDKGPSPEQAVVARSEAGRIARCLDELDPKHAAAVRWAYLDGLSYADLARKLDTPLNTIRTWLRRALLSLQECMSR
ncbi:sigma-70 family RNA polymerase sigma factor [Seohaeicola zhoushanensis]|uniref:RNA polymerase sigma factor n=1 Tax=Seohaeicola zhoushanensis TaxID=1569283 RepID=A0A8J3H151_9RHOB|nr:sigma-70 family RNA polymerase sigma factor [Seohaeicola zhoushanensis]GHF63760.1 RNA polymerase sigma factor [Seohaeicola zhoushanensis]